MLLGAKRRKSKSDAASIPSGYDICLTLFIDAFIFNKTRRHALDAFCYGERHMQYAHMSTTPYAQRHTPYPRPFIIFPPSRREGEN